MRIRKHAGISAPSTVSPPPIVLEEPDTRVCLLNRSPWDVIACTPQYEHEYQVKMNADNSTCGNTVGSEAVCAPESFACLEEQYWEDVANNVKKEEEQEEDEWRIPIHVVKEKVKKKAKLKREMNYIRCAKTDGKGWQCKKEAKQGELLCEHHLIQLQSYHHKYSSGANSSRKSTQVKRALVKAEKRINKGRVSASPADFYFYSGFGPSWGRKRGGNEIKKKKEELDVVDEASSSSQVNVPQDQVYASQDHDEASSASQVHVAQDCGNDDIYDEFDDDEEEEDNGDKKRIRRPIKARSLKSLL